MISSGLCWFDHRFLKSSLLSLAIEKGKFDPSLPLAFKLAQLFEMSIEDVFQVVQ